MRIGFVMDVYDGYTSGVTTYVSSLRRYFENNNHEVFVFCFGSKNTKLKDQRIVLSPGFSIKGSYYIGLKFSSQAREAMLKMDVLHIQHPFVSGFLAVKLSEGKNIPLVFTNHTRYDLYMGYYAPYITQSIGKRLLKSYLPSFFRKMDAVIAPSSGVAKVLLGYGVSSNIYQIFNGIELDSFRKVFYLRKTNIQNSSNGKGCTLMYVGRFGKEKNLLLLLKVLKRILQTDSSTRLILVGDGPERVNLESFIDANQLRPAVTITGFVPYSQVPTLLSQADLFVTTSVTEVHPLTVIEAMSTGLPVVAIRSTGIEDIVVHEETGLLSNEEEEAFFQNTINLIQNKQKRLWMGEKGVERANHFSLDKCGDSLLNLYGQLVAQKQSIKSLK